MVIHKAELKDLETITNIYNAAVINTTATFDTQTRSIDEQKEWFDEHGTDYPLLVCVIDDQVVGWAALSSWSDRCSYKTTGEVSIYVDEHAQGKGVGSQLLDALIEAGYKFGHFWDVIFMEQLLDGSRKEQPA